MKSSFIIYLLSFASSATAADTCTVNSGQKGVCISTSSCSSNGGRSEAGHCPGATNIQCCTFPKGSCPAPSVNAATISLIKEFEGFVATPQPDPIGLPTVGYGHLCEIKGCAEVPYDFPLTTMTASQLLASDLKKYEKCLAAALKSSVHLNANQYGALVSWTFNEGCGNMDSSTLITRLGAGDNSNTVASEELPRWVYAGGDKLPVLVRRRDAEVKLFKTASSDEALPAC